MVARESLGNTRELLALQIAHERAQLSRFNDARELFMPLRQMRTNGQQRIRSRHVDTAGHLDLFRRNAEV